MTWKAYAQVNKQDLSRVGGIVQSGANVVDPANNALRINCITGCSGGQGSGLTDAQLRASAVAIAGTISNFPSSFQVSNFPSAFQVSNFPATQPVSGTVAISNASLAVTGTFWPATQPVSGSVSVSNFPSSQAVTGTFFQATQPISGSVSVSNFPATQAVSGPLTDTQLRATALPVSGTFWQVTQPVSIASMPTTPVTGTFWQATQPISGSISISNFPASQVVTGAFFQATQPISGTVGVNNFPATQTVTGTVTANDVFPALTKGTTGVSAQLLSEAGRNNVSLFTVLPIVTTASEALLSLTGFKANALVAATTTPTVVTAGKTFRIKEVCATYVAVATAGSSRLSLRHKVGGVVAVTDPVLWQAIIGGPAAVAGVSQTQCFYSDIEIAGGNGIGVSQLGLSATQVAAAVGYGAITISGFEY